MKVSEIREDCTYRGRTYPKQSDRKVVRLLGDRTVYRYEKNGDIWQGWMKPDGFARWAQSEIPPPLVESPNPEQLGENHHGNK